MTAVHIRLNGEPVAKGRPRFARATGVVYTPEPTRQYEQALAYAGQAAMAGREIMDGPLKVEVIAAFPVPRSWPAKRQAEALTQRIYPTRRPDSDNLLKTLDALNGVVWRDDAQICEARIAKRYSDRPRLEIHVEPMIGGKA